MPVPAGAFLWTVTSRRLLFCAFSFNISNICLIIWRQQISDFYPSNPNILIEAAIIENFYFKLVYNATNIFLTIYKATCRLWHYGHSGPTYNSATNHHDETNHDWPPNNQLDFPIVLENSTSEKTKALLINFFVLGCSNSMKTSHA